MNYVKIQGVSYNLNKMIAYYLDQSNTSIIIDYAASESDSYNMIPFKTESEAQQCIEFLDKKTFCETFKLTKTE